MSHAVLHRWKVRGGKEDDFAAAWARLTDVMIELGCYGARLHRGEDGGYIAYSWWPSKQTWERAQLQKSPARSLLAAAVEERLPEIHMALVDERFPADEGPAAEYETPGEEAEAAADGFWAEDVAEEEVAEEVGEAEPDADPERPTAEDFDPDDPNAPL